MERFERRLVLARRLRALIAAGAIAFPSGAAASSIASEIDSQDEGVSTQPEAPNDQVQAGSETETPLPVPVDPVLDPEQDVSTGLPEGGEPPAAIPLEVGAPEGVGAGAESTPAPVEAPALPPPAAPMSPPAETPERGDLGDESPPDPLVVEDPGATRRVPHLQMNGSAQGQGPGQADPDRSEAVLAVEPPPRPAVLSTPAPEPRPVSGSATTARFHVVQPSESLWSIAAGLLEPGASAARVARQVHRLWKLNAIRIGTDDPDMLPAGVRLRLK